MKHDECRNHVIKLLEDYPDMRRRIAILRYELEHPATVSHQEMIEALSFARGDSEGHGFGNISNKTLYIAMNYQTEAARCSSETMDEITRLLIPLEREVNRLEHHVALLSQRQAEVIRGHYFERIPWEDMSKALHTSVKTLRKLRNEALDSLANMYTLTQGKI